MTALVHWPVVSRLAMSLVKQTSACTRQRSACSTHCWGEASDDLERVTPQSRECLHVETTRNKRRCSRCETPSEKSCARPETPSETSVWQTPTDGTPMLVPIPPSPPARSGICLVKLQPVLKTQPSRDSLEQDVDAIFANKLCYRCLCVKPGERKDEFKIVVLHHDSTEFCSRRRRTNGQDSKIFGCTLDLDRTVRVQTSCLWI